MFLNLMYRHGQNLDTNQSVLLPDEGKDFDQTGEVSRLNGNSKAFALSSKPKTSQDICFSQIGKVF